jgi:predicted nuclease of predicted toxin-antitoxin system
VRFLVDAQLPPRLAAWLVARGHEAVHVESIGLRHDDDGPILQWAISNDAVLVTKDRDFAPRPVEPPSPIQIVWIRTGNVSNRVLFERLEVGWPAVEAFLIANQRVVEIR